MVDFRGWRKFTSPILLGTSESEADRQILGAAEDSFRNLLRVYPDDLPERVTVSIHLCFSGLQARLSRQD